MINDYDKKNLFLFLNHCGKDKTKQKQKTAEVTLIKPKVILSVNFPFYPINIFIKKVKKNSFLL